MAVLHYGSESFPLPDHTNIVKLLRRISWASLGDRVITVELDEGPVYLVGGAGIPLWIDGRE